MSNIFDNLINAVQDGVKPFTINVGDRTFVSRQIHNLPKTPHIDTLSVHTLTGLLDYIEANPDELDLNHVFLHVVDQERVHLMAKAVPPELNRPCPIAANCSELFGKTFPFGGYQSVEQTIIDLQAKFAPTDDLALILSIIGNLKKETIETFSDDGITQTVETKQAVTSQRSQFTEVPPRLTLRPYRTFPEIEQPAGEFVFRMKRTDRDGIQCALFESNCSGWKMNAIADIAEHLRTCLLDANLEIPVIA